MPALIDEMLARLDDTIKLSINIQNYLHAVRQALTIINLIVNDEKVRNDKKLKEKLQEFFVIRSAFAHVSFAYWIHQEESDEKQRELEGDWAFLVYFSSKVKNYLKGDNDYSLNGVNTPKAELMLNAEELLVKAYYALMKLKHISLDAAHVYDYLVGIYALSAFIESIEKKKINGFEQLNEIFQKIKKIRNYLEHPLFETDLTPEVNSELTYQKKLCSVIKANKLTSVKIGEIEEAILMSLNKVLINQDLAARSLSYLPSDLQELQEAIDALPENDEETKKLLNSEKIKIVTGILYSPIEGLTYYSLQVVEEAIFSLKEMLFVYQEKNSELNLREEAIKKIITPAFLLTIRDTIYVSFIDLVKKVIGNQNEAENIQLISDLLLLGQELLFELLAHKKVEHSSLEKNRKIKENLSYALFELFDPSVYRNIQKLLISYLYGIDDEGLFKKALLCGALNPNAIFDVGSIDFSSENSSNTIITLGPLIEYMFSFYFPSSWLKQVILSPNFNPNQMTSSKEPVLFLFVSIFNNESISVECGVDNNTNYYIERKVYTPEEIIQNMLLPMSRRLNFDFNQKNTEEKTLLYELVCSLKNEDKSLEDIAKEKLTAHLPAIFEWLLKEKRLAIDFSLQSCDSTSIYIDLLMENQFKLFEFLIDAFERNCLEVIKSEKYTPLEIERLNHFFDQKIKMFFCSVKIGQKGYENDPNYRGTKNIIDTIKKKIPNIKESEFKFVTAEAVIRYAESEKYDIINLLKKLMDCTAFYVIDYFERFKDESLTTAIRNFLIKSKLGPEKIKFMRSMLLRLEDLKKLLSEALTVIKRIEVIEKLKNLQLDPEQRNKLFSNPTNNVQLIRKELDEKIEKHQNTYKIESDISVVALSSRP